MRLRLFVSLCVASTVAAGCVQVDDRAVLAVVEQCESEALAADCVGPAMALNDPQPSAAEQGDTRIDSPRADPAWVPFSRALALAAEQSEEGQADQSDQDDQSDAESELTYVPWRKRRGPAYPGHFWPSFGRWGKEMPETLLDDTKATFTNTVSLVTLAAAGVGGALIASSDLDDRVERHYTKNGSQLSTELDGIGGFGGNPAFHFPLAGAALLGSLAMEDEEAFEKSKTLMNALAVNGVLTLSLKVIARTESPNGDEMGWPSGHSSSSFCFATVMYHQYGPAVGVPFLAFATFVAYERVDARNHDFSDVISGSLIGIAIGHAVAGNHEARLMGMEVVPYVDPRQGTVGVALIRRW